MAFRNHATRIFFFLLVTVCANAHRKSPESAPTAAAAAAAYGPGGSFDITKLGAIANGRADSSKAVMEAWKAACGGAGKQTIVIPRGDFMTGQLDFTGPCKGDVTVQLDGNLLGSNDLSKYKANWIEFRKVDNLVIAGKGTLDGQGPGVWSKNSCAKNYNCKILPNTLVLNSVKNGLVSGITLKDAKFFHMNMFRCKGVTISGGTITAPEESPNTDGIHMGDSSKIAIVGTTIGTGDDCISIGPGSEGITITGVTCGPGHGISVGSLGRYKDEKDVKDITVKDCVLKNTSNGVRIKSYEDAISPITASKLTYENIKMEDVANPIIIDQKYCPNKICTSKGNSKVSIKDVTFKNITGTSSTPEAVSLLCSDKLPCSGVQMHDVKVEYAGTNNKTMAVCNNAQVTATGCLKELACL
uniref:Exopolygalacturonase n=1 Tax=Oryza coarctata TaxID=77588 RepID=C0JAB9_ORYCO|nr:exopolygalacturonase precursor [Oryza coarctata]